MAVNIVFPSQKDDRIIIGQGTKILDAETGNEIKDISKATISIEPDGIVMVNISIPLSNTSEFFGNPKK